MKIPTSSGFSSFGLLAEKLGREAVHQAIVEHKAAGNPIYLSDKKGNLIKEMPDGSQFIIKVKSDGSEIIGKQVR